MNPQDALSCVRAADDGTIENCSAEIRAACRDPLILACSLREAGIGNNIPATERFRDFCENLEREIAQAIAEEQRRQAPPSRSPLPSPSQSQSQSQSPQVRVAETVERILFRVKTASMSGAGTDSKIEFYACPVGLSDAALLSQPVGSFGNRPLNCKGTFGTQFGIDSRSRGKLERNQLNEYSFPFFGELSAFDTFVIILDERRGDDSDWTIGGVEIIADVRRPGQGVTRQVLYANSCLDITLNGSQRRLILRRSDLAACVVTDVLGGTGSHIGADSTTVVQFKSGNRFLPETILNKNRVADEFGNPGRRNRINSFGIPRVSDGGPDSISGFRFDFLRLVYRENQSTSFNTRIFLYKPGDPRVGCRISGARPTVDAIACPGNEYGRTIPQEGRCGSGFPLFSNDDIELSDPVREPRACEPLMNLDQYGNQQTGWSGFHQVVNESLSRRVLN